MPPTERPLQLKLDFRFAMAAPLGREVLAPVDNRRDYCAVFFKPIDQAVFVNQAFSDAGLSEFWHCAPKLQVLGNRLGGFDEL